MTVTTVKELIEAGVHFGAQTQNWNPQMKPFIHGRRNKIHIINLLHTVRGLTRACHFLQEVAATGRQIVFVCTKRQMRPLVLQEAQRVEMPWVIERWLGGTLTNFKTVRSRLARLDELEAIDAEGLTDGLSKKAMSSLGRERRRIKKNLDGLRQLNRIPGALLVIDPRREAIAVAEAKRMGVPVVSILDTDCDPLNIDIPIPANDDSMRSVSLLLTRLSDAIDVGVKRFKDSGKPPEDALGVMRDGEMQQIESSDFAEDKPAEGGEGDTPDAPAAPAAEGDGDGAAEAKAPDAGAAPAEGATKPDGDQPAAVGDGGEAAQPESK